MITLDPEQEAAVQRMVNEPTRAALNASQYGTGKTVVTVEVARRLGAEVKLIVAPLFTKYSWEKTILQQDVGATVTFINSKKSGVDALDKLLAGVPGWYIIGREYFASKRIAEQVARAKVDFLAYDECAKWANRKSQGFKIMKTMKPGYKMALSATPYGNKFDNFYSISMWLWPDYVKAQTGTGYWNWVAKWCATEDDFFAGVVVKGERQPGAYVSQLPCYIRLEKDFGEMYEETIEFDLSAAERRIYDKFEKYLLVWLEDNALMAKFPVTKRLRLREMTLGTVEFNPETESTMYSTNMKSTKYDTMIEYIKEQELNGEDEPMLIFTHSAKYAEVVAEKMYQDGFKAMAWHGSVPETVRHLIKEGFEKGEVDYIVATIASIGEGVDGLQHRARTMLWLSRDDNNMLNEQALRRLYRRGQKRQVKSIDFVARDTYDSGQLSNLAEQSARRIRSLARKDKGK